jgi:hypothetical protein
MSSSKRGQNRSDFDETTGSPTARRSGAITKLPPWPTTSSLFQPYQVAPFVHVWLMTYRKRKTVSVRIRVAKQLQDREVLNEVK